MKRHYLEVMSIPGLANLASMCASNLSSRPERPIYSGLSFSYAPLSPLSPPSLSHDSIM